MNDMEIYIDPNTNTDKILNRKELNSKLIAAANAIEKEYVKGKPRPPFIPIDYKPKYRIGDTFRKIGTRGYSWWIVEDIVYYVTEPVYVLKMMPFGKYTHEIGESELCKNWYNTTIKIPDDNELLKDYI